MSNLSCPKPDHYLNQKEHKKIAGHERAQKGSEDRLMIPILKTLCLAVPGIFDIHNKFG